MTAAEAKPVLSPRQRKLLSLKVVAERLGISMRSLYNLIEANELATLKIRHRRLVVDTVLDEFIDARISETVPLSPSRPRRY